MADASTTDMRKRLGGSRVASWTRSKQSSPGDAGQVQMTKRSVKRSPPVAMEIKILALEALDSGLSADAVGELVGVGNS